MFLDSKLRYSNISGIYIFSKLYNLCVVLHVALNVQTELIIFRCVIPTVFSNTIRRGF